jgi:hypothetical protein
VKNKYEKRIFNHLFLWWKKSHLDFKTKFENHVATFSYWFCFGVLPCLNFLNF